MALTDAQKEAQLRAVGWTPSAGDSVSAAWARTATPADQAAAAPGQTAPTLTAADLQKQITAALTPFSQQTSGVTAADLAERKRQFDANLEWTKQMWAQQGLPQLQIQQQAQALAQQEFEQQKALAQQNLALQKAGVLGYYSSPDSSGTGATTPSGVTLGSESGPAGSWANNGQTYTARGGHILNAAGADTGIATTLPDGTSATGIGPLANGTYTAPAAGTTAPGGINPITGLPTGAIQTEAAREFNANNSLQRAQLGETFLKDAASLGGPANYYQSVAFNRGAQQAGQTPAFLTALQNNTGMPVFNGPGGAAAAPGPQTMGTLAGGAAGTSAGDNGLGTIARIGAAGGQALAPQTWENMNQDEKDLFASGMKASGYSMPAFLQAYQMAKVGQNAAQAA